MNSLNLKSTEKSSQEKRPRLEQPGVAALSSYHSLNLSLNECCLPARRSSVHTQLIRENTQLSADVGPSAALARALSGLQQQ